MNNAKKNNAVPDSLFTPFKKSRILSFIFICLSMILSLIILYNVIQKNYIFTQEELRDLADFTLNMIFVVAALGFTIFTLPISKMHPDKEKIMFSYIGNTIVMASIAVCTYILSFIKIVPPIARGIYFCVMFLILCGCIINLLKTIVAYFNIRD